LKYESKMASLIYFYMIEKCTQDWSKWLKRSSTCAEFFKHFQLRLQKGWKVSQKNRLRCQWYKGRRMPFQSKWQSENLYFICTNYQRKQQRKENQTVEGSMKGRGFSSRGKKIKRLKVQWKDVDLAVEERADFQ